MIHIRTPRLLIREHSIEDLAPLHALMSDATAMYYLPDLLKSSLSETRAHLEISIRAMNAQPRLRFFAAVEDDDGFAGEVGYHVLEASSMGDHVSLGYFFNPDRWNMGYATEAARAMIEYAFENGAFRISASCLAENIGSRRVLEKSGLIQEGCLKAHTWHDGHWKDRVVFRLLRPEWAALHEVNHV